METICLHCFIYKKLTMSKKLKIAVAISSHSPSFYTKFTVGTLLQHCGHHDLNIHIGFHSNLSDYTSDFSMFTELQDYCHFHAVDEIDWNFHNRNIYRYSLMHSVNLQNIFKNLKYYDFDYLVILDNDVHVKTDFISKLLSKQSNADMIGSYHQDKESGETVKTYLNGTTEYFAPKISVWNMMISRKLFNKIMENSSIIQPVKINGIVYDTFAKVLHHVKNDYNMNLEILTEKEMGELIHHFYKSSFNYGLTKNRGSIEKPFALYTQMFPNGVYEYLKTNFSKSI